MGQSFLPYTLSGVFQQMSARVVSLICFKKAS
jgi:hypothetical protein